MLNVATFISTKCAQWRSSQPALSPEQREAEEFDPASVHFLSILFDALGTQVIGNLNILCDMIESIAETTSDVMVESVPFGPGHGQKSKSLRAKIGRISAELNKQAQAHNLTIEMGWAPDNDIGEYQESRISRRKVEIKRFLAHDEDESDQLETSTGSGDIEHRDAGRIFDSTLPLSFNLGDSGDDDEGSSEDNSFGADGDWGRDSEEEDDED
eukprot:CAMPEP_0176031836 /NCGR_PEP_ID=MMETSP0120_2-20121206/15703_1 /TAXON_ID=160619 /ORGANISM="Kryptoperidinium foliaceum, Strain CCMP 1326" /LENGTH=212 /DNA_ID=CAMNT_0017365139 /DNA_START=300 /DNA_END=938 /DNA_ORIENTATION=-